MDKISFARNFYLRRAANDTLKGYCYKLDIPIKYRLIGSRIEYDKLRDSILDFFNDKTIDPKDTVLFYFSGHGVLGDDGELGSQCQFGIQKAY